MFGGAGLYVDGLIVALEVGGTLYLKTDEQTRQAFANAGGAPFVYEGKGKPITMSYWTAPDDAMDSSDVMRRGQDLRWRRASAAPQARSRRKKPRTNHPEDGAAA